jgi:hypothetical protein
MAFETLTNDGLLDALDAERRKFTTSDKAVMRSMIAELIVRSVYPKETREGNPNTVEQMVLGWGARWFEWKGQMECPHCKADLRAPVGPPFKREIGVCDRGRDVTLYYKCPDCWETF